MPSRHAQIGATLKILLVGIVPPIDKDYATTAFAKRVLSGCHDWRCATCSVIEALEFKAEERRPIGALFRVLSRRIRVLATPTPGLSR